MYYTRPRYLVLSLVCLTGSLFAVEPAQPTPPTATEQVTQAAIKEAAKEMAAQAAPVTSQATELAKTGNEVLAFLLAKTKQYTGTAEQVISQAVDVGMREAKPTLDEFIRWRLWKHGLMIGIPIVIFLMSFTATFIGYKRVDWDQGPTGGAVFTICMGVLALFSSITVLCCGDDLFSFIQILVAPRIYLIEEISHLIRH